MVDKSNTFSSQFSHHIVSSISNNCSLVTKKVRLTAATMDVDRPSSPHGNTSAASDALNSDGLIWVLALVVGAAALALLSKRYGLQRPKNLPPGPRNWPLFGALSQMEPGLHRAFEKLAKKYGPVVYFRLGVQDVVLVSSAEAAEELLKHRDAEFSNRSTTMTKLAAKYTALNSAAFPWADYNPEFKLCRKVFKMEFLTGTKLKSYEELRGKEMAVMVEKVFNEIENSSSNSACVVGIREAALTMTQNLVFNLCMGKRFDDLAPSDEIRKFPEILEEGHTLVMKFNMVDFFPFLEWLDPQGIMKDMKEFEKRFRRIFERILERYRQGTLFNSESEILTDDNKQSFKNLVDALLETQEKGGEITDNDVMGSLASMLMAGIHTVAAQVEWTLLELIRHPNLLERLQDEIDGVVGKERPLQETDLPALPFLNAIITESLRLRPVAPFSFPHVNTDPSTLGGYHIPPKTAVIVNIAVIGRDGRGWRDPLQFKPDRFMAGESDTRDPALLSSKSFSPTSGSNYHFLPFVSGRRMCVGAGLAFSLLSRTVGTLVHTFEWNPRPGCSGEDLSIEEDNAFVLHPIDELLLIPTPRLSRHVYQGTIS